MRTLAIATVFVLAPAATAGATPCSVILAGDEPLVTALHQVLDARGIQVGAPDHCAAVHARVERRGTAIVVATDDGADGQPVERIVDQLDTAASVIESWVRTDVELPLLASHPIEPARAATTLARPVIVVAPHHVVQLFVLGETSVASDRTSWIGAHAGVCVRLGPVCAAARLRASAVAAVPTGWAPLTRSSVEAVIGIDVPLQLGRVTLSPGFGAGVGAMHTRLADPMHGGSETGGLRADVHATLSVPLHHHLALDVSLAGDLTQATDVDMFSTANVPGEPRGLAHLGAGLRYGGL